MPAFIDVTCQKCKKRYGFAGEMTDQPPCPKCGYKPSAESLKEAEDEMAKIRAEFEAELESKKNGTSPGVLPPTKDRSSPNRYSWEAGFD